jgi:hypothetical protein
VQEFHPYDLIESSPREHDRIDEKTVGKSQPGQEPTSEDDDECRDVSAREKTRPVEVPITLDPNALLKKSGGGGDGVRFSGYVVLGNSGDPVAPSSTTDVRGTPGHYVTVGVEKEGEGDLSSSSRENGYVAVSTVFEPLRDARVVPSTSDASVDPGYVTAAVLNSTSSSSVPSPSHRSPSPPPFEEEAIPMARTLPISNTSYMPGYVTTC